MQAVFKPVHNRKNLKNQKALIEIYCYVGGRKKYIPTGIRIYPEQWDKKRREVINHDSQIRLNHLVRKMVFELEELQLSSIEANGVFGFEDLGGYRSNNPGDFIDFLTQEIMSDTTVALGTHRYRKLLIVKLRGCFGSLSFKGVKYDTISKFDNYMSGLKVSTRRKHHQQLRKYIGVAVKKGLIKHNPYKDFKIKQPPRGLKKCLWYSDLDRIWDLSYSNMYETVRLKFLFSCYTGLRISDSNNLRWTDIRGGKIVLAMQKTSQPVIVPLDVLSGRTHDILDRMDRTSDHVFPAITDQVTNRELKKIGIDAGIPFPVNFHVSRHTFCTMVAHKTGSLFEVMRYAGIYQVSTAMTYINLARLFSE